MKLLVTVSFSYFQYIWERTFIHIPIYAVQIFYVTSLEMKDKISGRALDIRVGNSMTNSCLLLIKPNQIFNRTIVAGSLVKQTLIYPTATSQAKSSRAVGTEGAGVIAPSIFWQGQKLETLLFQNALVYYNQLITSRFMGSTNQADPSCFYFRIS